MVEVHCTMNQLQNAIPDRPCLYSARGGEIDRILFDSHSMFAGVIFCLTDAVQVAAFVQAYPAARRVQNMWTTQLNPTART